MLRIPNRQVVTGNRQLVTGNRHGIISAHPAWRFAINTFPSPDELFQSYFGAAYEEQDLQQRGFSGARPDVIQAFKPNAPIDQIIPLGPGFRAPVAAQIKKMLDATREDWFSYIKPIEDPAADWFQKAGLIEGYGARQPPPFPSLYWVKAFDAHYNEEAIELLLKRSNPAEPSNDFVITVVELTVVLGEVLKSRIPGAAWYLSWPYFDSSIYDPRFGTLCHVFDWSIKKFSGEHWDDGLASKLEFCAKGPIDPNAADDGTQIDNGGAAPPGVS